MRIFERVRRIVAASFQVPLESVSSETSIEDYADSLGTVELVMSIEEEFDIEFPDLRTLEDPPRTVGQLATLIERYLRE